ncbi:MAG: aldehyde dehydrogenase family protein [Nitrososphaerota archaeon]|nr:aldehyde dehydrogenase family protein [Nitrososphaerota archaeon]
MTVQPSKITYVTLFADESIHPKYEAAVKKLSKSLGKHYQMHIGDEGVASKDGEFAVRSPIDTSIIVGYFPLGNKKHARAAIDAASEAFEGWSAMPWKQRVKILLKTAQVMDERKFDIAAAITYEVGKVRTEALAEVWEAVDAIKVFARSMEENDGYVKKMGPGGPGEDCKMVMKPYGVWPVVSPFNFPFMLANGMSSGALITGNTVVLKPTSAAPLTALMLYNSYRDAGVPAGAVNFVTGPGANYEKEFTRDHRVGGIAFTGSMDVGMRLYREFQENQPCIKPVVMELGSKNPAIVTAKADLNKAVEGVVRAAYGYCGQKCSAASRVYVQRQVMKQFMAALRTRIGEIQVTDPRTKDAFMGPVINEAAVSTFEDAVKSAEKKGRIFVGGRVLTKGLYKNGYYVEPTVAVDLPSKHRLFKEELFIPFIVVGEFKTLDEALARANDTGYGLTAGIFSEDPAEVKKFLDRIQFGVVYANRKGGATTGAWPGAQTFVGWNASGATGKGVGGPNYLLSYMREQSQTVVSG